MSQVRPRLRSKTDEPPPARAHVPSPPLPDDTTSPLPPLPEQPKVHRRLGERLLEKGLVTENQLNTGLLEQRRTKAPLGDVLVNMGFLSEDVLAEIIAEDLGVPFIRVADLTPDPDLLAPLSAEFARKNACFPVMRQGNKVLVALARPVDILAIDAIKQRLWRAIDIVAASPRDIGIAISRHLEQRKARGTNTEPTQDDADIIKLTDRILEQGMRWKATDIHIEPEEQLLRVRYRIDGMLEQSEPLAAKAASGVIARIKIMSGLDITERRLPQDGRISLERDGDHVDLRVSIMPTCNGENAVLRVLDVSAVSLELEDMGYGDAAREQIAKMMAQPNGMLLVSGPTGSGKSTTMYALLMSVDSLTRKVTTIEDPIEYQQPLIRQSQVDTSIGYTFAAGLRAMLRQDPDVILVGEIRDGETAGIALKASLTGHFVISSIHTNSAIGVVTRLIDVGVDPYLVSSSMTGAIAQRLVRRLCKSCQFERPCTAREAAVLEVPEGTPVHEGKGCSGCRTTGYSGRLAVVEVFTLDDECASILAAGGRETELLAYARSIGMKFLVDDAREKVLAGRTTVAELLRVCPPAASSSALAVAADVE